MGDGQTSLEGGVARRRASHFWEAGVRRQLASHVAAMQWQRQGSLKRT